MNKVTIIAEAGVNHNGDLNLAKSLIDVAAEAGVDFVKFQTFQADQLVAPNARKADYQLRNEGEIENTQYSMLKSLELTQENHLALVNYCAKRGTKFFSTAFDVDGLEYLNTLGFDRFKIPSGEITNYPYLKKVASFGMPVILSTGMSDIREIREALDVLVSGSLTKEDITVLHCNTEYPTPMEDVNLRAMNSIGNELGVSIGYSDHTLGIEVPIAAVALGASVIEKHFTLDRAMPGPDHKASLEPSELKQMVLSIRNIEKAISGDGTKEPSASETKNIPIARKSIHLKKFVSSGSVLHENDLIPLRPGDGISPMLWNEVVGRKVKKDLETSHQLNWEDLIMD